jgi:hypothetical protein
MTPAEIALKLDGRAKALKNQQKLLLTIAHANAGLVRCRKMPTLKKFLDFEPKKNPAEVKKQKDWFIQEMKGVNG